MQRTEKKCPVCNEIKKISEFRVYKSGRNKGNQFSYCKKCQSAEAARLAYAKGKRKPMSLARYSGSYLGVYVAERALSKFFNNIEKMPYGNPGYDFVCSKGFKIDVKSSCLHHKKGERPFWAFRVDRNTVADYFLCLAFDDRDKLEPQHVWLIPGNDVNSKLSVIVRNTDAGLLKFGLYERPLGPVESCCNVLREKGKA